MSVQLQKATQ